LKQTKNDVRRLCVTMVIKTFNS